MNQELKEHLNQALKQGVRMDGRKLEDWREITLETDFISTAEGSARIKAGDCEIIAGVKMNIGSPFPDRPDEGVLMVGAELKPMSSPEFESGPPSIESIEVARVIDRTIRESKAIDVKKLCIEKGEKVWIIQVDLVPINADGNLIDLGALAALAALKTAKFPEVKDGMADYKKRSTKSVPLSDEPLAVTVYRVGQNNLIDPTETETNASDARVTFGIKKDGVLCAMQKGEETPLTSDVIVEMATLAVKKAKELRKVLK